MTFHNVTTQPPILFDKINTYYLLSGDIGGTYSRLSLHKHTRDQIYCKSYRNDTTLVPDNNIHYHHMFNTLIINPFLRSCRYEGGIGFQDNTYIIACLSVAGLVRNNVVNMTNMTPPLCIDGYHIESSNDDLIRYIHKCTLINDFVGQGYGLSELDLQRETIALLPHRYELTFNMKGPKACVGAGTGLGECYLTPNKEEIYTCYASEGGHADYTPRSYLEYELTQYLKKKFHQDNRISVERVVSGRGLVNVYKFLCEKFPSKKNELVYSLIMKAGDMQGRVIGEKASSKSCPLCVQAIQIVMEAYGSEVANSVLKYLPTGGMYVTGGMTIGLIDYIKDKKGAFLQAYGDKGRVSEIVKEDIPLIAVLVDDLGLRGARVVAEKLLLRHLNQNVHEYNY